MFCHLDAAVPIQRCVGADILQKSCLKNNNMMPGLLLPMLALKRSRVEKKVE